MIWKILLVISLGDFVLSEKGAISEQRVVIHHLKAEQKINPSHNEENNGDYREDYAWSYPSYEFSYKVKDPETHDEKGQHEKREGDEVKGLYWLIEPNGHKRTVNYEANDNKGFNAQVDYSPKERTNEPEIYNVGNTYEVVEIINEDGESNIKQSDGNNDNKQEEIIGKQEENTETSISENAKENNEQQENLNNNGNNQEEISNQNVNNEESQNNENENANVENINNENTNMENANNEKANNENANNENVNNENANNENGNNKNANNENANNENANNENANTENANVGNNKNKNELSEKNENETQSVGEEKIRRENNAYHAATINHYIKNRDHNRIKNSIKLNSSRLKNDAHNINRINQNNNIKRHQHNIRENRNTDNKSNKSRNKTNQKQATRISREGTNKEVNINSNSKTSKKERHEVKNNNEQQNAATVNIEKNNIDLNNDDVKYEHRIRIHHPKYIINKSDNAAKKH